MDTTGPSDASGEDQARHEMYLLESVAQSSNAQIATPATSD